jgi:hypothetical protein
VNEQRRPLDASDTWVEVRKMMSDAVDAHRNTDGTPIDFTAFRAEIDRLLASTRDAGLSDAQGAVMALVTTVHTLNESNPIGNLLLEALSPGVTTFRAAALLMEVLENTPTGEQA